MKFLIEDLNKLDKFAGILASQIKEGDVFSLDGDLGAGKTTLVQMVGKRLGIDDYITSPTFSLVNIYEADMNFYHLDLYRLEREEELEAIDFETYFYPDGVTFIEWAIRVKNYLPEDMIELKIDITKDGRILEFISQNDRTLDLERKINESIGN